MSLARYGFLPWLRQGISANINEADTLGSPLGKTGRPTVDISLSLRGMKAGANTTTPITGVAESPADSDKPVYKKVGLISPGDITGIKPTAVVKTEPLAGVSTFEPNYLPYIEFYEEDFPWRYTPAAAQGEKLRPWLVLVVVESAEFERRFLPGAPLSAITHGQMPLAFPPKSETWAWAHVQVNHPLAGADKAAALRDLVDATPNLASSRLICPRRLNPNTTYTGFLLPAFEQGRLAGLGAPAARIAQADMQACAWEAHPNDVYANLWPVYHEWEFRTGDLADFEYLVRRIEARTLEDPLGRRPIDLQDAGYELAYRGGDGSLLLEGALQLIGAAGEREDFLGGGAEQQAFISHLQTLVNLNTDLESGQAGGSPLNQTLYSDGGGKDDPIVTPPLYGQWHANTFRADASQSNEWFHELNLDPRNRVAAGFGTMVVRKNQDAYMDRAWKQVEGVIEARRRINSARFAAEAGEKLQTSYFDKMDEASFSAFSSSFHSRSRFEEGTADEESVQQALRHRRVQPGELSNLLGSQKISLMQAREALSQAQTDLLGLQNAIDEKEDEIEAAEDQIANLDTEIEQLDTEIADLETEIAAKVQEVEAKVDAIEDLQIELDGLKEERDEEEAKGDDKDQDLIDDLNGRIDEKQIEIDNEEQALGTLNQELLVLESSLQEKQDERQDKQSELEAEEARLQQLADELAALEQQEAEKEDEILDWQDRIESLTQTINGLVRLYLPTSTLRQDYRRLARPNGPALRRAGAGSDAVDALAQLSNQIKLDELPDGSEALPQGFNLPDWSELDWGAATFEDPPAEAVAATAVATTSVGNIQRIIQGHIQAAVSLNKRLSSLFEVQTAVAQDASTLPKPLLTYPEFKEAMYDALAELSAELMLPNVQLIPMDTFSLLEVNQRFIESYLIGLNHEMARELLWREYPTDQRGSYFRRFWDDLDGLSATPPPPDIKLLTALDRPLGENAPVPPDPDNPNLVFLIRSELLKKFPNALIFMQRAAWAADKSAPRLLTTGKGPDQRRMPIFKASIYPEISFFGFPITAAEALGDEDDPGWFFIVQERPGEARFGLDILSETEGDTFAGISEWNDLAWPMARLDGQGFLQVGELPALSKPPKAGAASSYTWGKSSAHTAAILLQLPFMVAVHATDMIKL